MNDTEGFLRLLGNRHTFQTFDDSGQGRPGLTRILHGTLAQHADTLAGLNARGAGVFVMVNAGNGKGRKAGDVVAVRALFVDLDGSPLAPVQASPLRPHCIVESSPGRWHAYWRISDCTLADFPGLQKRLAARFAGDPVVHDPPRVMRLPGFLHLKGAQFRSRILELHDAPPYTLAQVEAAFPPPAVVVPLPVARRQRRTLPGTIPKGERNATLLSLAGGLVRRGFDAGAVNQRLQLLNAERCNPPLCATEVDSIAASASQYGSDGFSMLTHRLQDSPEWRATCPATHEVVLMALRRFDGSDDCTFALRRPDFAGQAGFSGKGALPRHIRAAITAGFLVRKAEGYTTRDGRTAHLYAIAPKWLEAIRSCQAIPLKEGHAHTPKRGSVLKQTVRREKGERAANGRTENGDAA